MYLYLIVIYILLPKPIDGLLILVYLLQTLPRPNNMRLAIGIDQHLGRLGKAVVVLGTHPGAVRAAAIHHADVPNGRRPQLPLSQALGLAGEGGHEIATLAAVGFRTDFGAFKRSSPEQERLLAEQDSLAQTAYQIVIGMLRFRICSMAWHSSWSTSSRCSEAIREKTRCVQRLSFSLTGQRTEQPKNWHT